MVRHPVDVLDALRTAGHAVRRDGERIMIAPPPGKELGTLVRENREAILQWLAMEAQRGWPADEDAALTAWRAYNAAIDAQEEARRERGAKRHEQKVKQQERKGCKVAAEGAFSKGDVPNE